MAKKPQLGINPKDKLGLTKVSLSKVPASAILVEALAMMDGAKKYNAFNWRSNKVIASIYIDACKRHLDLWFDSLEEVADDSKVPHLGHARACIGIIVDAQATGNLVDDRPLKGAFAAMLKKYTVTKPAVAKPAVKAKAKKKKAKK